MLGNLLSSANVFSKLTFPKISFRNTIRVSNILDPDQDRHPVGPDLGPNCLQKLSADDKSHCYQGKFTDPNEISHYGTTKPKANVV